MKLGDLSLSIICDGTFWLDGGAMFGVVPKVLWKKLNPADDLNRIKLSLNCLLIKHPEGIVLVDTGIGENLKERFVEMYRVERNRTLFDVLAEHKVTPQEVTHVINTHLHFDHCSGNTRCDAGRWRPAFPRARYIIQEKEWDDALNPNERTQASYLKETFMPLQETGQLFCVAGEYEVLPGIRVLPTNGHTRGHQSVLVESGDERAFYLGDFIPTTSHLRVPYLMGYDLYPSELIQKKKELLQLAVQEHWLLIFEHDPKVDHSYIQEKNGKFVIDART